MASQLSKLMINAGANLIRYPDLVLVMGLQKKKKKKETQQNTTFTEHSFQGIHWGILENISSQEQSFVSIFLHMKKN